MPLLMHLKGGIPFLFFTCLFSTRLGALWRQGPCTFHLCKESACSAGDLGSIPGSGRSPGEETTTHSSILDWEISWTEGSGGLQSMG